MAEIDEATDLAEVVHVLRLARDDWPDGLRVWSTEAFASAAWHGFLTNGNRAGLTSKGRAFLAKVGALYPEVP